MNLVLAKPPPHIHTYTKGAWPKSTPKSNLLQVAYHFKAFVLDEWKVCSYTIIPLLLSLSICDEVVFYYFKFVFWFIWISTRLDHIFHSARPHVSHASFTTRSSCPHLRLPYWEPMWQQSQHQVKITNIHVNIIFHRSQVYRLSSFTSQRSLVAYVTGCCHIGSQQGRVPIHVWADKLDSQCSRLKSSMPFKRDVALQNIPLSKQPFKTQPRIENRDITWSPKYNLPATRTNKRRALSLQAT